MKTFDKVLLTLNSIFGILNLASFVSTANPINLVVGMLNVGVAIKCLCDLIDDDY